MKQNVFLLIGDSFLIEEKTGEITASLERKNEGIFKQSFYLKDTPLAEILTQARTLPFLVSAQVFRIVEADRLKKEEVQSLSEFLHAPTPKTCLIFEAASLDKRHPLIEAIRAKGQVITFDASARQSASSRFIREKLRQFGRRMDPQAQRRLEQQAGDSPAFLDSILNQILTYAPEDQEITEELVEKFEESLATVDVFHLVEAISSRRTNQALRLLHQYVDENPRDLLSLMGLLHWQMKRLWKASTLLEEGQPEFAVLKKCRVFSRQRMFMQQVRSVRRQQLEKAIEKLFQLDWDVKSGNAEDFYGLERWVIETTG